MSSIFRMERHHGSGSSGAVDDTSASLEAEKGRLVDFVVGYSGVHETVKAVGKFLQSHGSGLPWFRMYHAFPSWHQKSGLLNQALNKDTVRGPMVVFCTLIKLRSKKALESGTWHSKGPMAIGSSDFVMTKLYYRDGANRPMQGGFTVVEFVLKTDQPRVAICVLHPTDYRHLIRDLRQAADENEEQYAPSDEIDAVMPSQNEVTSGIPTYPQPVHQMETAHSFSQDEIFSLIDESSGTQFY